MHRDNGDIAITGLGWTTALGDTLDGVWVRLAACESGLAPLTLFEAPRHQGIPVGQIVGDLPAISGRASGSRSDHLALIAAKAALSHAGLGGPGSAQLREKTAIVLGACTGGMLESEVFLRRLLDEQTFSIELLRHHLLSSPAESCAEVFGLGGIRQTVSTACASGASAIAVAGDLIRSGQASIVVAGGVDALTRLTIGGFGSLMIMDPHGCRPFDSARAGMNLGEAAAVLVLERGDVAARRGAPVHAWLTGWGSACDARHPTRPAPDGAGLVAAMRQALAMAGLDAAEVDYINAHGTGTIDNDLAEGAAICQVFARPPAVSSTKRSLGHTLAAAGAVEAVVAVLSLRTQVVPGTAGLVDVDPAVGLTPLRDSVSAPLRVAMSNSQGFGGNCCALIMRREGCDGPS